MMKISFEYTNELAQQIVKTELALTKLDSSFLLNKEDIKEKLRTSAIKYAFIGFDSSFASFDFDNLNLNKDSFLLSKDEILIKSYSSLLDFLNSKKNANLDCSLLLDAYSILSPASKKCFRIDKISKPYSIRLPFSNEIFIPASSNKIESSLSILLAYLNENDLPLSIKGAVCFYYLLSICPFEEYNVLLCFAISSFYLPFAFLLGKEFYLNKDRFISNFLLGLPNYFSFCREEKFSLELWIGFYLDCFYKTIASLSKFPKTTSKQSNKQLLLSLNKKDCILISYCQKNKKNIVKNNELALLFNVTPRAISKWAKEWVSKGILIPESGQVRTTSYRFSPSFASLKASELNGIK